MFPTLDNPFAEGDPRDKLHLVQKFHKLRLSSREID